MKCVRLMMLTIVTVTAAFILTFSASDALAQASSANEMAEAADAFLASLGPEQREMATLSINDEDRFNWQESPRPRMGIPLRELDEEQTALGLVLLKTGVGEAGYREVEGIQEREIVLANLRPADDEQGRAMRQPDLYFISIFGTPSDSAKWGWRFEGHHLSLNFTVSGSMVSTSPMFIGQQPAAINDDGEFEINGNPGQTDIELKVSRGLGSVEDKARDLVHSFNDQQRAIAVFDRPETNANGGRTADMLTGIGNRTTSRVDRQGLEARDMSESQRALLSELLGEYLAWLPPDLAADRSQKLLGDSMDYVAFAWTGSTESGWHYYTVQGPTFIIEYAQARGDEINHVHTVWRDFSGDFGDNF